MGRKRLSIIITGILILLAVGTGMIYGIRHKAGASFSDDYIMAKELPALLQFTYYDTKGWEKEVSKIAKGKLSYKELEEVLQRLGVESYVTYKAGADWKNVPRHVFFEVYDQVLDLLDGSGKVTAEDRVFLGGKEKEGCWLTNKGYEQVLSGKEYIAENNMYRVYLMDGAVIGLRNRLTEPVTWTDVFVHHTGEGKVQVLFEKELLTIAVPNLSETITDTVCDLVWTEGTISAVYKKEATIQGTVISYNEEQIEIAGYGSLKHSGNLRIYKTYGTVEQLDESKLVIGNLVADFVVAKGQVCGIILKEPAGIENMRVLLLNGDSPYYPSVYVMSNEETTVTFGEQQEKLVAGTVIRASDYWSEGQEGFLRIDTATDQGEIMLVNENGESQTNGYQGSFEVRRYPEGLCVVNELSLEDYLCGVVPSEMPASYEMEALRAQAVCARSYASIQLTNGKYAAFGANVDDTTNYQVYNKQVRDERTTLAVRDTVGEVLKYEGTIAEAYYYSTSCGFTQGMEVWNQGEDPGNGYLKSTSLLLDGTGRDFSKEEVFVEFIKSSGCGAYDSDMPYYRWQANLDLSGGREEINKAVTERRAVNKDHVQIFDSSGNPSQMAPAELGAIVSLATEERTSGGVQKKLRINCEKGSILLTTEYNIRKVLGGAVRSLADKDGKDISPGALLPSAAFVAEQSESGVVLFGGGYGHGIGLSQNGANGMAKAGLSYTDILQKFYQNITIENIYNQ